MKYTQEEIQKNIDILSNRIDEEKRKRTDITKNINRMKKDLENWIEFDTSQTKLL